MIGAGVAGFASHMNAPPLQRDLGLWVLGKGSRSTCRDSGFLGFRVLGLAIRVWFCWV